MTDRRPFSSVLSAFLGLMIASIGLNLRSLGDTIVLKNGVVYHGVVDKDNTLVWVYDGLKRVALRTTKIARTESDASLRNPEMFQIKQPLVVHAGAMPKEVIRVEAGLWNDRGRRTFAYEGARIGKPIRMEQAIIDLGPRLSRFRGVDGFWLGQLSTSQIPREVVLGILGKVDQQDRNERVRVGRFLIQAEWYAEARAELEQILKDFPDDTDLRDRVTVVRDSIAELEGERARSDSDRARLSRQFRKAADLLASIPAKEVSSELLEKVREAQRAEDAQTAADDGTASDLRTLAEQVGQSSWNEPVDEVLKAMKEAPDAVRDRLLAWRKSKLETPPSTEAQFALAMSGYVVGSDAAIQDLKATASLWKLRGLIAGYLASREDAKRSELLGEIDAEAKSGGEATAEGLGLIDTATRLARLSRPPLHDDSYLDAKAPRAHRVLDDQNAAPTDYLVAVPPEYHPLRRYPAVVALHDGTGPSSAVAWWAAEAARRGFIVVAPEYRLQGQRAEYGYSTSEHAAVVLALRDAKRHYSIDDDRVFLGGQLVGGNMAWDFGLAHPDLFAGVVVISGLPFKYVGKYLANARSTKLPLYVALGDLAPAGNELVFQQILKPMITDLALDAIYLEYHQRGLEDFPEEAPGALEWMESRTRAPNPKSFEVVSARESDVRFYGLVVREFDPDRTTAPGAVDPFGKNLKPATLGMRSSTVSNSLMLTLNGVRKMDIWVSPDLLDFKRRMEIKINGKTFVKGMGKPDIQAFLEDLRVRGDRGQIYWLKVPAG